MKLNFLHKRKMEKLRDLLKHRIKQYLRFDRDYVNSIKYVDGKDIKSTTCHQNKRCHLVSRTIANANSFMKVVPCICIGNDDTVFVHFINYDIENEVYIDNTLGVSSIDYSYFMLDCYWIDFDLYKKEPDKALHAIKEDLYYRFLDGRKDAEELIAYYGIDEVI